MVVIEDLRRLKEADAMFLLILPTLLGIPFEYQHRASNSNLTFAASRARGLTPARQEAHARVGLRCAVSPLDALHIV